MKSAYRVIAILAVILVSAGILSSIVAVAVAGSVVNLVHDANTWWGGTEIHIPELHIGNGDVRIGDEDGGIIIDQSQIHIGDKRSGIHITIDDDDQDKNSD